MLKFGNKNMKKTLKKIAYFLLFTFLLCCILPYLFPLSSLNLATIIEKNPTKKWANIDDILLHYQYLPTKSKTKKGNILLVHGFSGSTFSWRKNTDSLQNNGYDVIMVDLPCFGLSDRTKMKNHSPDERAKLLIRFLKKYFPDNQQYILFGHSMGASVVLAMTQQMPDAITKVFLVDGAELRFGKKTWGTYFALMAISFPPVERWIAVIAEYIFYTPSYFQNILDSAYQQKASLADAEGYLFPFKIEGTTQAILRSFRYARNKNETDDFSNHKANIYMIWGRKDTWVPIKNAENFIKKYPKTQLFTFEDAGHSPMETHHKEFNQLIIKLLNQ